MKTIPDTEFSQRFADGMKDRMGVSYCKYGPVADAYPHKVDALASLKKRLEKYETDGNTEWLMDVANFAMIEFMHPRHSLGHFKATDSDASPGRVWNNGTESATANTADRENQRLGGSAMATAGGFYAREGD